MNGTSPSRGRREADGGNACRDRRCSPLIKSLQAGTAILNRTRGLLSEGGVVVPQKAEIVRRDAALRLKDPPSYANSSSRWHWER